MVLRTLSASNAYPLFLGRPWLSQARVVHDWKKGTLTIVDKEHKVKLAVHGEFRRLEDHSDTYLSGVESEVTPFTEEEESSLKVEVPSKESNPFAKRVVKTVVDKLLANAKEKQVTKDKGRKFTREEKGKQNIQEGKKEPKKAKVCQNPIFGPNGFC